MALQMTLCQIKQMAFNVSNKMYEKFLFQLQKIGHKIVKVLKHSVRLHNYVKYFSSVNLAFRTRNKPNKVLPNGQKNQ